MRKGRAARLALIAFVAIAIVAGAITPRAPRDADAREATSAAAAPAATGTIPIVAISPAECFVFVILQFADIYAGASHATDCTLLDSKLAMPFYGTQGHAALMDLEQVIGDGDGVLEPSDFASIDVEANQVHQSDDDGTGTSAYNGNLLILAFVPSTGPVTFSTDRGLMIPAGLKSPAQDLTLNPADPADPVYLCDDQSGTSSGPRVEDGDCTGDPSADGVVVGRLRAHWGGSTADIGPGTVSVSQGATDTGSAPFYVVGEPQTVSFTTFESSVQEGVVDYQDCPFLTDSTELLAASGTPERSLVLAVARDVDGNAVTGAVIEWSTDDGTRARMAAGIVLTLDLGSLGLAAPNIVCGNTTTGTVNVQAWMVTDLSGLIQYFDPGATVTSTTAQFTVTDAPDTDADGCKDYKELHLVPPTNPNDPWDFYSVPVPALFQAPDATTDFHDSNVSASDAQAVFAYFKNAFNAGTTEYEQDRNLNGIKDGLEYDRSYVGPGATGPPDGVIAASDAQLAFAQFKSAYAC